MHLGRRVWASELAASAQGFGIDPVCARDLLLAVRGSDIERY